MSVYLWSEVIYFFLWEDILLLGRLFLYNRINYDISSELSTLRFFGDPTLEQAAPGSFRTVLPTWVGFGPAPPGWPVGSKKGMQEKLWSPSCCLLDLSRERVRAQTCVLKQAQEIPRHLGNLSVSGSIYLNYLLLLIWARAPLPELCAMCRIPGLMCSQDIQSLGVACPRRSSGAVQMTTGGSK